MNRPREERERKLPESPLENAAGGEKSAAHLEQALSTIRATVEATTDGILVTDESGRITLWNENLRRLWAFPPGVLESRDHRRALEWMAARFERPAQFLDQVSQIETEGPTETITRLTLAD
jgi:PAS domain-containing protein